MSGNNCLNTFDVEPAKLISILDRASSMMRSAGDNANTLTKPTSCLSPPDSVDKGKDLNESRPKLETRVSM